MCFKPDTSSRTFSCVRCRRSSKMMLCWEPPWGGGWYLSWLAQMG